LTRPAYQTTTGSPTGSIIRLLMLLVVMEFAEFPQQ